MRNFGETPHSNITKIDSQEIPKYDVLCVGFPCQAFTISGKRLGFEDARGSLFFEITRIVKYHKPKVIFLENLKNLVRHDKGRTLKTIENILKDLDYDVFCKVINASNFGIPTARERIYILGFHKNLGINKFEFPKPLNKTVLLKHFLESDKITQQYVIERDDITFFDKTSV